MRPVQQALGKTYFKGKTVLVTGGAGFLGSWVCHALLDEKSRVICLDNLASGLESNISSLLRDPNFSFIPHDITKPIQFDEEIHLVLHMASRASPLEFERFPLEILKANTVGTSVALGIAQEHQARLLYMSSSEIYGNPSIVPTPETYEGKVDPVGPRSCYDEAKRCGEAYVMAYRKEYGLDVRIARTFNTYGPRMRADGMYGRVVPRFVAQALKGDPITIFGSGKQTRSFCYVTDQIEGLLRLARLDEASGEVVNIGDNDEIEIIELAQMIKDLTNSDSEIAFYPLPQGDPERRRPDTTKAKTLLSWKPEVGLEQGLSKTIEWFRNGAGFEHAC